MSLPRARRCLTLLPTLAAVLAVATHTPSARADAKAPHRPAAKEAPADAHKKAAPEAKATVPDVVFETSLGNIVVRLFAQEAPLSSQNLLQYVDAGFYDGLIFHRVIPGFMVQGGGFDPQLKEKATSRPPVPNESIGGAPNRRGTLAMARTPDPNSARAQFFINVVDNKSLDASPGRPGYAVVGEVVSGIEVVDAICKVPTRCSSRGPSGPSCDGLPPGMQDVPQTPVVIRSAHRQGGGPGARKK